VALGLFDEMYTRTRLVTIEAVAIFTLGGWLDQALSLVIAQGVGADFRNCSKFSNCKDNNLKGSKSDRSKVNHVARTSVKRHSRLT